MDCLEQHLSLGCSAFPDTRRKLLSWTGGSKVSVILSPACERSVRRSGRGGRGHLWHEAPEEGLALVGAGDAVVLVVLDRALDGSRGVLVRHKQLNAPKLPILQLLHLPLEGGVGANVLKQAGLVVQPQLLLFLLALLMVLVELAHLRLDEVLQEPVH